MPVLLSASLLVFAVLTGPLPAMSLEFLADQITRSDGHTRRSSLFYRDDRWRLEHNDPGPVGVTIVRKDKQRMWFLLPRMKHFKTLPYDPKQAPMIGEQLDGEVSRDVIGHETRDGHPTTLYEVKALEGGIVIDYYQWIATDLHLPLRLTRKDGTWTREYRNLKLRTLPDELFQIPLTYLPLEDDLAMKLPEE